MNKITLILLIIPSICLAGTGGTKTVKETGGDYSSLTAWEAGEQGVLNTTATAVISGSWTSSEAKVTIDGWTTFSTAPIHIYTTGASRHSGIWNTTCHRISDSVSGGAIGVLQLYEKYIIIDGLQLENTRDLRGDASGGIAPNIAGGGSNWIHKYSNCIINAPNAQPNTNWGMAGIYFNNSPTGDYKIWNNIVMNFPDPIEMGYSNNGSTFTVYNNTMGNLLKPTTHYNGLWINGSWSAGRPVLRIKNNVSQRGSSKGKCYNIQTNPSFQTTSNNISNDPSSPNTSFRNSTATFYNATGGNYLIVSTDTVCFDNGVDLSADPYISFATDIAGNRRPIWVFWDIGAYETYAPPQRKRRFVMINK